ncbi:MAG: hypothetical protein QM831_27305 [Kofleriaceae bacterium]
MRFVLVCLLALAACHHDSDPPVHHPAEGEVPPLPPASGTPVGYLIDSSSDLKLRDDQLAKLKEIDQSLAATNADIDVQLRQIERPEDDEQITPQEMKAGKKPNRHNHAPGAMMKPNGDANKLHAIEKQNNNDALKKAWAILDADQQVKAKAILDDHGVEVPGKGDKKPPATDDSGTPLPGMEP